MRWTLAGLMPSSAARVRVLQCVAVTGGSRVVLRTPAARAVLHRRRAPSARRGFLDLGRPLLREPAPPQAHGLLPYAKLDGDGLVQPPVGGPQHDLGASHQARRRATTSGPSPQDASIFIGHCNGWGNS